MFSVVLFEPEIPPNTGNIIRLCANSGCGLHLIEPLGFELDEKKIRRAGLDYQELANVSTWPDWQSFTARHQGRIISFSTRNQRHYSDFQFHPGDALLFGSETRGLPENVFEQIEQDCRLHIPMLPNNRSLNLSNCVAIGVYEAWRQQRFVSASKGQY